MLLRKGPNIASLPEFEPLPESIDGPVLLKVGDDISTDEIMPAGAEILPFRSNIPEISQFVFRVVDETYPDRALAVKDQGGHLIVAGTNYGQGSSREHAAIAPRYLGLRAVLAKDFARIHQQNLVNFGILPLTFADPADYDAIEQGDRLVIPGIRDAIREGVELTVQNRDRAGSFLVRHELSERQIDLILTGSLISFFRSHASLRKPRSHG